MPNKPQACASDSRKFTRTTLNPPLQAVLWWTDGGVIEEVGIVSLSERGCAARRSGPEAWSVRPTGRGRLQFSVPKDTGFGPPCAVRVEVRSFRAGRLGLEFVDSPEARLEAFRARVRAFTRRP